MTDISTYHVYLDPGTTANIHAKGLNLLVQSDLTTECSHCPHKNVRAVARKFSIVDPTAHPDSVQEVFKFECCQNIVPLDEEKT